MRVYFTSPWIPAEWIKAHGFEPCAIWTEDSCRHKALSQSAGVCAFAEGVVSFVDSQPDTAVIFTTSCDQMRRGFDTAALREHSRAFLFNLPATQTPAARQMIRSELERLGEFLVTLGGQAPPPVILRYEMHKAGNVRQRLLEAAPSSSAQSFAKAVDQFHRDGTFAPPQSAAADGRIPLALVGGPLPHPYSTLFKVIEACGGQVTLNATETGERSLCPPLDADTASPFDALADGAFDHIADVFQRPNTPLYSWLRPRLVSRKARGIFLWHFTNCDLWRAEAQTLRDAFGLPVLMLEAGTEPGATPRDINRIQAFIEMLK